MCVLYFVAQKEATKCEKKEGKRNIEKVNQFRGEEGIEKEKNNENTNISNVESYNQTF